MSKKVIRVFTVFTICLFISYLFVGADEAVEEQDRAGAKPSAVKLMRDTFSLYTTSPLRLKYWEKLKLLINQGHAYFFPPNIDFRGSEKVKVTDEANEGSAGENVKEAAARSLEKTKSSMEETAKMAGDVVHKAAEKMNKIKSSKRTDPGDEL